MFKRRCWMTGLAAAALCAAADSDARAGDERGWYVAPDGSDSGAGTRAEPLRTLSKAAGVARAGDTIFVRGGVYAESVILRFSGEKDKPIVLRNHPGERPVIQPGERGKKPPGHGILLQSAKGYQRPIGWITIEGMEIRHG
jgi:hypothetical protein